MARLAGVRVNLTFEEQQLHQRAAFVTRVVDVLVVLPVEIGLVIAMGILIDLADRHEIPWSRVEGTMRRIRASEGRTL